MSPAVRNHPRLEDALALAIKYHAGQKDKGGDPYILHICRVMLQFTDPTLQMIAVLHDIVEDTVLTIATLADLGYPKDVVSAVDVLTRKQTEEYSDHIERCRLDRLARKVKIADLEDHLRHSNRGGLNGEQIMRYMTAYHRLTGYWPYFWRP